MNFYALLVVLAFWVFQGIVVTFALNPPDIITPGPLSINANTTLVLICHGDSPLHWFAPHVSEERLEYNYSDSSKNSNDSEGLSRPYATTLTLANITGNDVGDFSCVYNETNDESSIYVYVIDSDATLVNWSNRFEFLTTMVGQSLEIPCKPTSPLVTITINHDSSKITLDKNNYDPKYGLLIDPVAVFSAGYYQCIGKRGNATQEMSWNVDVTAQIYPPILRTPTINATNNGIGNVGKDFILDCVTHQESHVYYNINWTQPSRVINSGRAKIEMFPLSSKPKEKAFMSRLTVMDAKKEDSGLYVCQVVSLNSSKNITQEIRIYDANSERFLNVTTSSESIEESGGKDAKWVINVHSYPTNIDYAWTRNNQELGREPNNKKHFIENKKNSQIILTIMNVGIKDFGPYKFVVKLPDSKDSNNMIVELNLDLIVKDKPSIIIRPKQPETYFMYGNNYTLTCSAKGFPTPSISWYFQEDGNKSLSACPNIRGLDSIKAINTTADKLLSSSTISFNPLNHGMLTCRAENEKGVTCQQKVVKVIDFPGDKEFGIVAPSEFIDQDYVVTTCALSKLNGSGSSDVKWKKKRENGQLIEVITESGGDAKGVQVKNVETEWSYQSIITFTKINKANTGEYICLVGRESEDKWAANMTLHLQVQDMIPPKIHSTNLNNSAINLKEGDITELTLHCSATGIPKPVIEWTKDGLGAADWPVEVKYFASEDEETLTFPYIRSSASGNYRCTARNRNGTDSVYMDIEIEGKGIHPGIIVIIVGCVIIILILLFAIVRKNHKKREMTRYLEEIRKKEFEEGAIENINPELGIEDQANLLPYDNKWEFPRNRLRLGMQLGSGAFGRVMKADAIGIIPEDPVTTVAVKMVKANADESHIKALMSELKIMVHLGKHVNVVNLLGAVTTNLVKKKELFVIVEFCKYGSILSYIHRHRHTFINQLDPLRGVIDSSIYRHVSRSSQQSEAPRLNYASLTFADTGNYRTASNGYRTLDEIPSSQSATSPIQQPQNLNPFPTTERRNSSEYYPNESHIESMCTDMSYISTAPTTICGTDGKRRSSGASSWGDGNYRGDYHHVDVRPIRSVDLLGWAFQVARGMEYLASRKVLHGDLATRNVLLADNNVVKICDFGLAKEMYKDYKYKKKSEGVLLPVKWMAIESIYYGLFSTHSDVWSFGVVLWELFTLGKTPYPGMDLDDRFYKLLSEGYRMEKPPLAPSSIYDIMTECWAQEPAERPTFSTLVDRIGDLMDEGHRQQYVDLNVPYDRMNREWLSGREDYLSKMNAPDFATDSHSDRPNSEHQYENIPQALSDASPGYLIPITPNPNNNQPPTIMASGNSSTSYQNVAALPNHSQTNEPPPFHNLANNAGYVTIGASPNGVVSSPYVKYDIEPNREEPTVIVCDSGNNSEHQTLVQNGVEQKTTNSQNVSIGISNISYVPNNLFPPTRSSTSTFTPNNKESFQLEEIGSNNSKHPKQLRRQKNDSGLGSIDSTTFENRSPVDWDHNNHSKFYGGEINSSSNNHFMEAEKPHDSQHNVCYTTHSFSPGSQIPKNSHNPDNAAEIKIGSGVAA